jgi:hypothetical protein
MSDFDTRTSKSKRLYKSQVHQHRQAKLAKLHGLPVESEHYYNKHHAMDCGNPQCPVCGNPRYQHKHTLTIQEQRFYQQELQDDNTPTSGDHTDLA